MFCSATVCPGSSDPFYVVIYYIKWVTTSWTYSIKDGNISYILGRLKIVVFQNDILDRQKYFFYAIIPNFHVHEK